MGHGGPQLCMSRGTLVRGPQPIGGHLFHSVPYLTDTFPGQCLQLVATSVLHMGHLPPRTSLTPRHCPGLTEWMPRDH